MGGGEGGYLFDLGGSLGVGEAVKGGAESGNDVGCLRREGGGQRGERDRGIHTLKPSTLRSDMMGNKRNDHTKLAGQWRLFNPRESAKNAYDKRRVVLFRVHLERVIAEFNSLTYTHQS